ncbi:MAG TPA: phage major capsid protein, partial [Bacillota bacterium]|nr:phage major capsid protein [Bacillota bacterium]
MIEDRLKEIAEQKKEIRKVIENEDLDIPELEDLDKRLDELLSEEEELRKKLDTADKIMKGTAEYKEVPKPGEVKKVANIYDTEEYRTAFLSRLMGKPAEKRTDTTSQSLYFDSKETTGAGAVIPTQTANVLFDKMVSIAPMLNEINLLRVAGNLKFAIPPDRDIVGVHTELEEVAMTAGAWTEVTLGGYEYVSVFRISKTVATMSINAFEGWLTDMLAADLAVAIENAII